MLRSAGIFTAALAIAGCASAPAPVAVSPPATASAPVAAPVPVPEPIAKPKLPHYTCDQGVAFDARFADGSVELLFASREPETLLRDAGGTSPDQVVYSSTALKAEFGTPPQGRGAKLNFVAPLMQASCIRE